MENKEEQAAAARAAQQSNESKALLDDTDYTDLERISESQMTALLTKREGVPTREDGTPYTYKDASPEALDNCNRQLSTCSVWRAVWSGKTSHNGNVMYKIEHAGDRYYYYRDLIKMLGAPSQRAEKSEASKARKAAALAQAAALAEAQEKAQQAQAQAAAAMAQAQRYADALTAAAKDGTPAEEVLAHLQAEDAANALAKARHDMTMDLSARGYDPDDIVVLVDHKLPLPAKPSETAPITANGTKEVQVTSQPGKAAAKAQKTAKKSNK